jgi:hypothetical protein
LGSIRTVGLSPPQTEAWYDRVFRLAFDLLQHGFFLTLAPRPASAPRRMYLQALQLRYLDPCYYQVLMVLDNLYASAVYNVFEYNTCKFCVIFPP